VLDPPGRGDAITIRIDRLRAEAERVIGVGLAAKVTRPWCQRDHRIDIHPRNDGNLPDLHRHAVPERSDFGNQARPPVLVAEDEHLAVRTERFVEHRRMGGAPRDARSGRRVEGAIAILDQKLEAHAPERPGADDGINDDAAAGDVDGSDVGARKLCIRTGGLGRASRQEGRQEQRDKQGA
jgi:hypothetical protein